MTVTKSANVPEGIEIIPKITEIGNYVCFVNTTNKEITLRGSKVQVRYISGNPVQGHAQNRIKNTGSLTQCWLRRK